MGGLPIQAHNFSTSSVLCLQSSSGGWAPPQPPSPQGLLPEEEVPSPALRHEAPGNTGGLCSPSPLVHHGAAGEEVLVPSCQLARLGPQTLCPAWHTPSHSSGWAVASPPELSEQPSGSSPTSRAGRLPQAPVKPASVKTLDGPFFCSIASTRLLILGRRGH